MKDLMMNDVIKPLKVHHIIHPCGLSKTEIHRTIKDG